MLAEIYTPARKASELDVQGFLRLPELLCSATIAALRADLDRLEKSVQRGDVERDQSLVHNSNTRCMVHHLQFEYCPAVHQLITSGPGIRAVRAMTGDQVVCTGVTYAHCKKGYQGLPLHTDFDPYANNPYRPSNPIALRVLYYLDPITEARAPLRVVPQSHLNLHRDWRYDTLIPQEHPDEVRITCNAGAAVIINTKLFHGVGPNTTAEGRRVIAITYRPRWARPLQPVQEHDLALLQKMAPPLRTLFEHLNAGADSP